ncbi:hypothetical protein BG004_003613, partial [Podila humilis]
MAGVLRSTVSPLALARGTMRVAAARACPPALARTFLINVKPGKKSKQEAATSTTPASSTTTTTTTTSSSSPAVSQDTMDSKYRIETPSTGVVAFAHRFGLNKLKDQTLPMRIVTHASYERVGIQTNERLDYL